MIVKKACQNLFVFQFQFFVWRSSFCKSLILHTMTFIYLLNQREYLQHHHHITPRVILPSFTSPYHTRRPGSHSSISSRKRVFSWKETRRTHSPSWIGHKSERTEDQEESVWRSGGSRGVKWWGIEWWGVWLYVPSQRSWSRPHDYGQLKRLKVKWRHCRILYCFRLFRSSWPYVWCTRVWRL